MRTIGLAICAIFLVFGCAEPAQEEAKMIETGWERAKVVELLGKPALVRADPNDSIYGPEDCKSEPVSSVMIYHAPEKKSVLVFMDHTGKVTCVESRSFTAY